MKIARTLAAGLLSAACLAGAAGTASASVTQDWSRTTQDVAGDVFRCTFGDLTVTEGTITIREHMLADGQGTLHLNMILKADPGVVLTDDAGNLYSVTGTQVMTGKAMTEDEPVLFTSVDHFLIRSLDGGRPVAKVQYVMHASADGHVVEHDAGACMTPSD